MTHLVIGGSYYSVLKNEIWYCDVEVAHLKRVSIPFPADATSLRARLARPQDLG